MRKKERGKATLCEPCSRKISSKMRTDILLEQRLDLFGHVAALDEQTLGSVDGTLGGQLGHEEGVHVLDLPMHEARHLRKVGPHGLARADTHQLRWRHDVALALCEIGILLAQLREDALEELVTVVDG